MPHDTPSSILADDRHICCALLVVLAYEPPPNNLKVQELVIFRVPDFRVWVNLKDLDPGNEQEELRGTVEQRYDFALNQD